MELRLSRIEELSRVLMVKMALAVEAKANTTSYNNRETCLQSIATNLPYSSEMRWQHHLPYLAVMGSSASPSLPFLASLGKHFRGWPLVSADGEAATIRWLQ
ncbi:hypothetical protein GOP47_0004149 [Adiantum capillus-veneris]|uniref:Uncharacterized protein n=1 Tax=Adiantum capillus-veneris TaxID=13818 RepID=A0A9D4ZPG7_ADICA|nr:hypothetical protein GOP47_0004149 [Adiantum capillus-veneris]